MKYNRKFFKYLLTGLLVLSFPVLLHAATTYVPSTASEIETDVSNFDNNLNATDTDVQKALDTLDNMTSGGIPGGSNTSIQYNNSGAFGGDANLTWTPATGLSNLKHSAFGANSTIDEDITTYYGAGNSDVILGVHEIVTAPNLVNIGIGSLIDFNPADNHSDQVYNLYTGIKVPAGNTKDIGYLECYYAEAIMEGSGDVGNMEAGDFVVNHAGSGTMDEAYTNYANLANTAAGTITAGYGAQYSIVNTGAGEITIAKVLDAEAPKNTGAGTIGTGYGLFISSATNSGGGTFTNNYGAYISDQSAVGSTLSYNLYSAGATAKNLFEGPCSILSLYNLTSDGFIKTSGGTGVLGVDTTTYLPTSGGALSGQYASAEIIDTIGGGTVTVDWDAGNVHYMVLDAGANTITLTNPLSGGRYILNLQQSAAGAASTVTFDPVPYWAGGTPPTLTATNDAIDVITFEYSSTIGKYVGSALLDVK